MLSAGDRETHNTAADSSRYASKLHDALARRLRPGVPTVAARLPSRSPPFANREREQIVVMNPRKSVREMDAYNRNEPIVRFRCFADVIRC